MSPKPANPGRRPAGACPLAVLVSTLFLAACGGGGGSSSSGATSNPVRAPEPQPTATSVRPAFSVSSAELANSQYVGQSGAKAAWDQGYTGKGVTVAILDSGINGSLSEFAGRIHSASGNIREDSQNRLIKVQPVTDDQGHGTWVASVLASGGNGEKTVGIAPEATILALGFYGQADMTGGTSMQINLGRLDYALQTSRTAGASVINGSFSIDSDSPTFRNALQASVAAGQLLVFSAGNAAGANPVWPARYAKEAWANGQIIAVGAVDANNVITGYSNRAGDAMQFFLVARGDVQAVARTGSMMSVAGTSFSSPQVAGAAALLKQKWPQLTASQIAGVLFTSATDLGAPGVDAVYGQGLLNIDKAVQPIGQVTVATPAGTAVPLAATGLALPAGGVASAVARAAAQGAFTVAATDSFGRDFTTNLAPRISRAGSLLATDLEENQARNLYGVDRRYGSLRFSVTPAAQAAGERTLLTGSSFFGYGETAGWQFAGGSNDRLDHFFGLESASGSQRHPYLALARDGRFAGTGFALSDNARVRAGTLAADAAAGQVIDLAYSSRNRFQLRPEAGDWAVALTAGTLAEKDRLLGMAGSGAFALAAGKSTFTTLGARYWLDGKTELDSTVTLGRTGGGGAGILAFSPVTAWSAEARIARSDAWLAGDRLSLSIGKPMVVSSGTLQLTLPTRISDDGLLGFRDTRIDLGGGRTETRLGLAYTAPASKNGKLSLTGIYRNHADNEPGRRESIVGLHYRLFY